MNVFKFHSSETIDLKNLKIETSNVDLVSISLKYAEDIYREFTDEITKYMIPSTPKSKGESEEFILRSIKGMNESHEIVLAIVSKTGEFLGCTGFHGRGKCNTPEFGVWVKKSAHGNGYGKIAITSLHKWARDHIKFEYAIYPVDKANIASRKIPESLGGKIFCEAKVPTLSGSYLNEVIYHISA